MKNKNELTINISAIYLVSLSAITIAICLVLIGAAIFAMHIPPKTPGKLPPNPVLGLPLLLWSIWCFVTGVGVLKRRSWARYSLLIISAFAAVTSLPLIIISLKVPIFFAILFVTLIVIPVFFIAFFKRKAIKEIFK
ncbi:MAG: hypothetical protein JW994_03045 [Candidatus Omnitrophica bacterium]|nr:hypothetical protein [Candidatus Omnitrophota bacterium]